jgi:hypothetical protein
MLGRIVVSLLAIGLYETAMILAMPRLTIATGQAAGGPFEYSDTSFVAVSIRMGLYGQLGALPAIVLGGVLLSIWWGPVARRLTRRTMAIALCGLFCIAPAQAYDGKTDYTGAYTILPNQSAFWAANANANAGADRGGQPRCGS